MNFKSFLSRSFIGFLLVCFTISAHAQQTTLVYKVKGKNNFITEINFSGEAGALSISPEDFFKQSNIYFTLKADISGKGVFKESEIDEILSRVNIIQNKKSFIQTRAPQILSNEDGRIDRVVLAFLKSDIKIYNDFSFGVTGRFSAKISLDEKYFESFEPSKAIYDKAMLAYEATQHIDSYKTLFALYENSLKTPEIKTMSFYKTALETIDTSVAYFLTNAEVQLDSLNKSFVDEGTEKALDDFKASYQGFQTDLIAFDDYFKSKLKGVESNGLRLASLKSKTENQLQDNIQLFKEKRMAILEQSNYADFQYTSFIDIITRVLIEADSLWLIDKLPPIDLNKVESYFNNFPSLYESQKQESIILIGLINDNIEQGFLFNDEVLANLEANIEFQKQPYFEILMALNALENDKPKFEEYLNLALAKNSDLRLLKGIELWQFSFMLTQNKVSEFTLSQINEGARLITEKSWMRAEEHFNNLMRQISNFAPIWYYKGEIKYNQGEPYSAEIQFKRALDIHPEYIAPRKYILDLEEDGKRYNELLTNSEEAITTFDTWLFRYYKAKALVYLKKYDLAIEEISNNCITKNKWNTDQYFLLGDAYLELNRFDDAKAAYSKTQEIDLFSTDTKRFDDKMKNVYQKEKERPKAIPKIKPEPTTVMETADSTVIEGGNK